MWRARALLTCRRQLLEDAIVDRPHPAVASVRRALSAAAAAAAAEAAVDADVGYVTSSMRTANFAQSRRRRATS